MIWARAEDTAAHLAKFSDRMGSQVLGRTGLTVSTIGFGTYRVHEFDPEHREALRAALLSGVNLIDTSSNYTDGSAERLVGEVLGELFNSGRIARSQIVIVTKAGYVQGSNLFEAKRRIEEKRAFSEMVEVSPDCWHCISPDFLEDQISRSLARINLECLDIMLLHNPEYFLKSNPSLEIYYARLKKAFQYLETEVERKRIRFYGVSSNTFPEPEGKSNFTSLDRIWALANEIKKNHHLAVIQFPMNLFESGAALVSNNHQITLLECAREYKLGTLVNRPFNSYHRDRLVRLTSFPAKDVVEIKGQLHILLGKVVEMEKRILSDATFKPPSGPGLSWGHVLRDKLGDLGDLLRWREAVQQQILPQLEQSLSRLPKVHDQWANDYREGIHTLVKLITALQENLAAEKANLLAQQMATLAPDLSAQATLSQRVLRVYRSVKGVSSVLVGMRKPAYVEDVLTPSTTLPDGAAIAIMSSMSRIS